MPAYQEEEEEEEEENEATTIDLFSLEINMTCLRKKAIVSAWRQYLYGADTLHIMPT
jgi:hypothetical protein